MLDRLRLYRRVHNHLLKAPLRDRLRGLARLDRDLEELLHPLLTNALPPPRHLRWMNWQLVAEELLPTEELPIGVLDPPRDHLLIRQAEGVLEKL